MTSWEQMQAWADGMQRPVALAPQGLAGTRVDHLPRGGALLRELAGQDTLAALIPPQARPAVTVGACLAALVLTILTGEPALSRVAHTWAGSQLAVLCQRPRAAVPCHDKRVGRALEALWTTGLARLDGAVITQAIRP
jgi:hypothetical protein